MHRLHFYTLMLSFFLPFRGYGVIDSASIIRYNLENGLPSNNVYSVMQDRSGYLWFCTDNGLVKYNGYTFKTFNAEDGLPTNDIWKVYEDRYGRIWFYCRTNEIGYIKNDVYHKLNVKVPDVRHIVNIREYKGKVMLEGRFHTTGWICLVDSSDGVNSLFSGNTWPVFISTTGNECVVGINDHLYAIQSDSYRIRYKKLGRINDYRSSFKAHQVSHYLQGSTFVFYAIGEQNLYKYDLQKKLPDTIPMTRYGGTPDEGFYTGEFLDTSMVIYTDKAIYYFDLSLDFIKRVSFINLTNIGLLFSHYIEDKTGNGWISSNSVGSLLLPKFNLPLIKDSVVNRLAAPKHIGILKNGSNCWWSTAERRLLIISPDGKVVFSNTFSDELYSVLEIDTSNWLFAFQKDLVEYNPINKQFKSALKNRKAYLSGNLVAFEKRRYTGIASADRALVHDSLIWQLLRGTITIAEYKKSNFITSSLFQDVALVEITDTIVNIKYIAKGKYNHICFHPNQDLQILYDAKEALLLDTKSLGLIRLGKHLLPLLQAKSFSGFYFDQYNNLYIHAGDKLVVYNLITRWATPIRTGVDLNDAQICIFKDKIIIAGAFGLGYIPINGPLSFGNMHTLPNVKKTWYNKIQDLVINDVGRTNILTDKGVFYCYIDDVVRQHTIVERSDNGVINLLINKPYIQEINTNDTVLFEAGVQSFTFDAINFYGSGERYFAYYVEGVSKLQQTATGEILITNLRAGRYYNIKCRVRDEMRQSKIFSFYIYKQPYWYETATWKRLFWLFGILVIAGLVILTVAITRYYVNRANEKKGRLLDLELRAVYSQINPHFIFNTLSSAQYFIDRRQIDDAYTHVSKFSKLLRSYLKSSQERYVTLSEEIGMLRNYIELQQTRFEQKFEYTIEVDNKIPADSIRIPSLLLQPLVENAINHGLFHKKAKGHLNIKFEQGSSYDELICTIEDDGVGRLKAAEINKENTVKRESYGTMLTQKLIEIFKEYEGMDIHLDYADKQAPATGTIVKLTLRNLKYEA